MKVGKLSWDDIIVTKLLCMEGTSIVVNNHLNSVGVVLTQEEIQMAKTM